MVGKKSKILIIILIFMIVFNFSYPVIYAEGESTPSSSELGAIVDHGLGLLINPIIMLGYWFGEGIRLLTNVAGANANETVTPETILFNKLEMTNINFFEDSGTSSFAGQLKNNIASWYSVMRTIAIVASICVLLYIGIRMATSTLASEKAEYKRMFIDWLVGFVLIFVLHYIIILVITGNNLIVDTLKTTIETPANGLTSFIDKIADRIKWNQPVSETLSATFVFLILVGITLAFLLMYIKRMIVVAFLIIIAPLITITYSIDKVSDSKSQALDSWLKEFIWTVLIQPFHCVIYVVFVSVAVSSLDESTLSSSVLAIMCLIFILQAEDIVKKIFGIQADNIGKMSNSFAMAAGGALVASKLGGKAAGGTGKVVGKVADKAAKLIPETKDGSGVGTGPTGSNSNSFSQKIANTVGNEKVQNALKSFSNFMEDNKFGKGLKTAGNVAGKYADYGFKGASVMTGVALSMPTAKGAQDLITGGMTGYAAGQAFKAGAKWIGKKGTTDVLEAGRTRNAVINLNESYKQMQQKTGFNDEDMFDKARAYLKMDLGSEIGKQLGETERLFAYNLQVMKNRLEKAGADTSAENVLSKINLRDTNQNQNNNSNNQEQKA